ncbi:hypothetical protein BLOT_007832 [Blomia tropicalis]|nr:hypothetical protein BLOT_007832 [Blomia tropicalis]
MDNESLIMDATLDANNLTNLADNGTLNWASDWLGYIALCMFSMVLLVPTLGIVGLMVWEYFSDEAERKAERQKEIDLAEGEIDDEKESSSEDELRDVDEVLQQAETMLKKRHRPKPRDGEDEFRSPDDFDAILT